MRKAPKMMRSSAFRILSFFCPFFSFILVGCEVIDPKEEIPSFVRVQRAKVQTDHEVEGTGSHDIRYGWVYVDDQLQGVYELPNRVLVTEHGHHNIKVRPGIPNNAMTDDKTLYPFFQTFSTDRELIPDSTINVEPVFRYYDPNNTPVNIWHEDFDDPNSQKVQARSSSEASLDLTQDDHEVFEGHGSGKVELTQGEPYFFGASEGEFQFETSREVYLELDYKTTDTLNIGILAEYPDQTVKRPLLNLTKSDDENGSLVWKKAYAQLTPLIGEEENAIGYEIFIQAELSEGRNEGTILIDNFKVLYQGS